MDVTDASLQPILILLAAAVLAVVGCRFLALPPIIGYLAVGLVLGPRALETRQAQARDLREKVLLYEDLLNVGLADLHRSVDAADQAAATAALLLGASASSASRPVPALIAC